MAEEGFDYDLVRTMWNAAFDGQSDKLLTSTSQVEDKWMLGFEPHSSSIDDERREAITTCVKLLTKHGADVNQVRGTDGNTPLIVASYGGWVKVVQHLINPVGGLGANDRGANVKQANNKGFTALVVAAEQGHKEVVDELLLELFSKDVNWENIEGFTALAVAAEKGHKEVVKKLIDKLIDIGVDVNKENKSGITPLIAAAQQGHYYVVELISKYADVNKEDNKGFTALYYAAEAGHENIVNELINWGAIPSSKDLSHNIKLYCHSSSYPFCDVSNNNCYNRDAGGNVKKQTDLFGRIINTDCKYDHPSSARPRLLWGKGGGSLISKRKNTKRRNTKRRNTKRKNTKRRNTKRKNTKRRNTKRRNTNLKTRKYN